MRSNVVQRAARSKGSGHLEATKAGTKVDYGWFSHSGTDLIDWQDGTFVETAGVTRCQSATTTRQTGAAVSDHYRAPSA